MQHVFIIGSKGIPGAYGGYETFVDKLTEYHQNNKKLKYHVACKSTENGEFEYHNARCFNVKVPDVGAAQAIYYDIISLKRCCDYIKKNHIEHPIIYILACRIGLFIGHFQKVIHKLGGKVYLNPDGHEFLRAKWSAPVRKYWKISEQLMVKHADLLICDSKNIEKYIQKEYGQYHPKTTFIAYGSETRPSQLADDNKKYQQWLTKMGLTPQNYYLVVGRFVPENNFETMICEFMKSKSKKDFAIITTDNNAFLEKIEQKLHYRSDNRIKFVGTVYDQELLKKIREKAYGYLHGHEVGGTNPSLLEALSSTKLNLLLGVGFNREVGEDVALYWRKDDGNLASLIEKADAMKSEQIASLGIRAKKRIAEAYSWVHIVNMYEQVFLQD
ncbi:beta 1-4 rhamnosyltransferase Cps2T [Sporolactobacillus spathodeae]|uniref:Rhamnosyltransferase n=1 Tax=Sporolactobacillus spathodeae TaxID=1465502 RepID=A0ABS2Q7K2_9BACL|nr:glycosyltransferase family 1 protein [Sporolactobacillus spathodeae]MBM7657757.1 rhamnosyltransferase [Sporolactobacillus spathodeae]